MSTGRAILLPVLMLLAACSPKTLSTPPMLVLPTPPSSGIEPCAVLPMVGASSGEVVSWIAEVSEMYLVCNSKRQLLVDSWPE
jgi:hypothetical protein